MEMELLLEQQPGVAMMASDAASLVLSRLPHPDTAAADVAAFVDAATGGGGSLSFLALRRGALSLASGLRLGLGLRRGDAVLIVLSPASNPLLLPQIVLGVLAAGCVVVVAAGPDVEISAAAHSSGAVIIVAEPGEVATKAAGAGVPVLLTSRSPDPRTLSAEELIEGGGDPLEDRPRPSPSDVAFVAYSSSTATMMTHADLIAAMIMSHDDVLQVEGGRVCLASLPICSSSSVHGLPLLALGLPAAGTTTVLMAPPSDPRAARDAVAAHGATDVVATPEAAAVFLAAAMPLDDNLSSLRRVVIVAPLPLAAEARLEFHRRLPWVELTELFATPQNQTMTASPSHEDLHLGLGTPPPVLTQTDAALMIQNNSQPADQASVTREIAAPVQRLKKVQKILFGDIFSRSNTSKNLTTKEPGTYIRQAASKL